MGTHQRPFFALPSVPASTNSASILVRRVPSFPWLMLLALPVNAATANPLLETHEGLKIPPAGAVELISGNYQSLVLGRPCPFRVFSPVAPEWKTLEGEDRIASEGMRPVVYMMHLEGVPRPGTAADRAIMEGLIEDGFLVVAVDFKGGRIVDHLEWQKDINGLFCVFGGEWHTQQEWGPGVHAGGRRLS